ncbi:MAG: endonuclease NucS [Xenococcaceae cyanobacterium MO_207.B15]|nr:endonuclease NucS [Xenococcaceae cyanobacterium MO_207.B15]
MQVGKYWHFESEAILEYFVLQNLDILFNLLPIARQYRTSNNQICDILAVNNNRQLTILELKNTEDRYIIQQLTRYYDDLIKEKPFTDKIDYQQSVSLIAITPSFHRDNFIDIKYHTLNFELWKFKIIHQQEKFYFQLIALTSKKEKKVIIPYQKPEDNLSIPNPPRALLNILSKCSQEEKDEFLKIRKYIFSVDYNIEEISSTTKVIYGKNNHKFIAEIRFDSKRNNLALFIWLPLVNKKYSVGRMRIWTDWKVITDIGHIPKGLGSMITWQEYKLKSLIPKKKFTVNPYRKSAIAMKFELYKSWLQNRQCTQAYQEIKDKSNSLEEIIDYAIDIWHRKI